MTMAYILAVNPNILAAAGMDHGAVFTATAVAAFIGTLCMALFANYPFALAPGMGLNAYFAYTVVLGMGYSWQVALAAVLTEGIIFILLSLFNVREAIFNAIPFNLKKAVSVGIGLFITFIGLQNAKIVIGSSTLLSLFSLDGYNATLTGGVQATWNDAGITVLLAIIGVIITAVLVARNVKGNISLGHPDHLAARNHLSADRCVCAERRTWFLQPTSGFFSRNLNSRHCTDLCKIQSSGCFHSGVYRYRICISVCRHFRYAGNSDRCGFQGRYAG